MHQVIKAICQIPKSGWKANATLHMLLRLWASEAKHNFNVPREPPCSLC